MKKIDILIVFAAIFLSVQTAHTMMVPIKPYFDLKIDAKISELVLFGLCFVFVFFIILWAFMFIAKICCKEKSSKK